jgi:hypothetical protein
MIDDDTNVFMTEYGNLRTGIAATSGIGTIGAWRDNTNCRSELQFTPTPNTAVEVKTFMQFLKIEEDRTKSNTIDLNGASIRSSWDVYGGTFYDQRTEFDLLHGGNQVFERNFDG